VAEATKIGKRGTVVIPAKLRRLYGLEEGALVIVDGRDDGVLIRPAVALPIESYSAERKAELLLSNSVDDDDYEWACKQVRELGLDPKDIPHERPSDR
jgi:AbrB family looped-hinge helix DNA binding protein